METNTTKQTPEAEFKAIEFQFIRKFKRKPTLEAILLLIGFQECPNSDLKRDKEEKVDLINLGVLIVLEKLGFFVRTKGKDTDWPQFEPTNQTSEEDKEVLIKRGIVIYFKDNSLLD